MIKASKDILEEVVAAYNRDPHQWHVTLGRDEKNRTIVLFQKNKRVWQVKTHHVSPYRSYGVGGTATAPERPPDDAVSFGWRDVSPSLAARIQSDLRKAGGLSSDTITRISELEPRQIDSGTARALEGPFTVTLSPLVSISKGQAKLDSKLSRELDRLLLKSEGTSCYG